MSDRAMDMPENPRGQKARRVSLAAFGVIVAAVAFASSRALDRSESELPPRPEVALFRLERLDGRLHRLGSMEPFTGWMLDYSVDRTMKSRSAVVAGLLHGVSEGWFTNGVLQVREHFTRGISVGLRNTWYPSGRLQSEETLVAGRLHGVVRRWHENGVLAVCAEFKDGNPDGASRAWYASGSLKAEALMRAGEVVQRHFFEDGDHLMPASLAQAKNP
jgi:hypothetical protein